ncbi:hypothetical protein FZC83_02175 [Rossellomorea marisflavi]|uniref:Uncharacterized protein n=1 Tax=Rossellomorea marisflavi TaxID=189381 RepID=A0A5D4RYD7_9BACI|nr:hypothetical protein [Rossellomorea marisflavi]TYS56403.1 hypothetical protein FZC83_02175 [Rossellomorea marisflavi]
MNENLANLHQRGYYWYGKDIPEKQPFSEQDKVGKFTTFTNQITEDIQKKIVKAVNEGAAKLVKHSDPAIDKSMYQGARDGEAIIWYSNDEKENLTKLGKFLVDNGLVPKTKAGRLYNLSFKYDSQTRNNEYGDNFKAEIKLADLINLNTGEVL